MNKSFKEIITILDKVPNSLGLMYSESPLVLPILKALPKTELHLYFHDKTDKKLIASEYRKRVKFVNLQDGFPKYLTPISPLQSFYDYAIIDDIDKTKVFQHIWPRINIGGVLIPDGIKVEGVRYKKKWVIIMGCCRGATRFISKVIGETKALQIPHQRYGRDGIVGGETTGMVVPENSIVIHQVRNPLGVIAASSLYADIYTKSCEPFIGYRFAGNRLLWGMNYWYYWNLIAEQKACWTYRVESLPIIWDTFCQYLGLGKCDLPKTPGNVNSNKVKKKTIYPHITWDTLHELDQKLTSKIKDLAIRYGYRVMATDSSLSNYKEPYKGE